MLTDYRLKIADGLTLPAATATVTKSIDLQEARDPGEGEQLWYFMFTRGPSDDLLTVELIAADNADLTTNVVVWLTATHTGLSSGRHITIPVWNPFRSIGVGGIPVLSVASSQKRYVGLRLTSVVGEAATVIGTLSPPAISPLIYPASTSS